MLKKVAEFEKKFIIGKNNAEIEPFNVGDTITVGLRIVDGSVSRIQDFTGVCIAIRNKGAGSNIDVFKISSGVGVKRNILIHSPYVAYIKCIRKGSVRKAKIYYLLNLRGKKARIKEKVIKKND